MKVTDSGMPEEDYWNSLFNISLIIDWLDLKRINSPIVEVGCGYGTFTLPVANKTKETVIAFDIETSMIATTRRHVEQLNIQNVQLHLCDIIEHGTGLESNSIGMALLFNILHFDERRIMLEEAARILKPCGVAAILHWRKDIQTPRGPSNSLRPDKQIILESITGLDLSMKGNDTILEPYHWGMQLIKGKNK